MDRIRGNWLLICSVGAALLYWTLGALVPGAYLSGLGSLALLVFGSLSCILYSETAFRVVVMGDRSEADDGSHLAVYGAWLLSAGLVWSGVFGFLWVWFGQPSSWTGTAVSSFGRVVTASGVLLMYLAPQTTRSGLGVKNSAWILILAGVCLAAGVLIGLQIKVKDPVEQWRAFQKVDITRPQCSADRTVWVAKNSRAYHLPDSRYRSSIIPRRCYASEAEAKAAGYSAARSQ